MYSQNTESINNSVQHHTLVNRKTGRHYSEMHTDLPLQEIEEGTRGIKTGYIQKTGKVTSNTREVYDNIYKGVKNVNRQNRFYKRVICTLS